MLTNELDAKIGPAMQSDPNLKFIHAWKEIDKNGWRVFNLFLSRTILDLEMLASKGQNLQPKGKTYSDLHCKNKPN